MNLIRLGGFLAFAMLGASVQARDLKTLSGDVFKNVAVAQRDATGVQIAHEDGVIFLDFKNLAEADQKELGFDPATYADGWVKKLEAAKLRRQQQALAAQQAAARAKAQTAQTSTTPPTETWRPTNQTGLEVTIEAPGFRYGPYEYYGTGFGNTILPNQGGTLVPAPYNANGPYPYYYGPTWGPTIIRRR